MQVSMPSARMSILRMPSRSRSSLSHSMTVRSSIAAFSIGTSSDNGPRVITKPPTCCERWRGKPTSCAARSSARRRVRSVGSSPASRTRMIGDRVVAPAPDDAGERGDDIDAEAQYLADFADRRARAVANDGGGETGPVAPVFLVDVLDDFLAPLVLEIDIDVGRLVARGADEALEQDVDPRRIDRGDAEAIANDRIGGRAAALAQDAATPRKLHDVVDGQKIAGIVEPLDQLELVLDQSAHSVRNSSSCPSPPACGGRGRGPAPRVRAERGPRTGSGLGG